MRRKIILGFLVLSALTVGGGLYIMLHIERTSEQLKGLLTSHQAELMRRNLLERMNRVQFDFYLINTKYSRGVDTIVSDVQEMQTYANQCLGCHHHTRIVEALRNIHADIEGYKSLLSRVLTMRANLPRAREEERAAYEQGRRLITTVNQTINQAGSGLAVKTQRSLEDMERTKRVVYAVLIAGPLTLALFALVMVTSISRPLRVILNAIGMLKKGDLNFRIAPPLKNEFGEVAAAFNEMAGTLDEQMRQMQQAEQMAVCGQLAAGLAHEIKNPLAGIKAAIEVLSDEGAASTENQDMLLRVIAEIRRLESLMKNFLDFARPPKPQFVSVQVNGILEATIDFLLKQTSYAEGKGGAIEIRKEFDPWLPEVTADPQQLRQVFINLLLNAKEAMPRGGEVAVRTAQEDHRIRVEFTDNGCGIPPEKLGKVFQPFFTTKPKGTGLGLAICRQLIQQHEGAIAAENKPGGGATFRIFLPRIWKERQET